MASSRKPAVNLLDEVSQFLKKHVTDPSIPLTVAVSGGLDSVVLLSICKQLSISHPFKLNALHINHQLQPVNDEMQKQVQSLCQALSIPLEIKTVKCDLNSGLGLEKAAREARYDVFKALSKSYLLLAHHKNDQAETLLTQLFRGSGLPGLSAMPEKRSLPDSAIQLLRPLIHIPRSIIYAYAKEHGINWVEDPSNQDVYYSRNYIRQVLTPVIEQKFPHWVEVAERCSHHFATAQKLLDDLALLDYQTCTEQDTDTLIAEKMIALGIERAANLLRFWLVKHHLPVPQEKQWTSWWDQVSKAKQDKHPRLDFAGVSLVSDHQYWYVIPQWIPWHTVTITNWGFDEIEIPGIGILSATRVLGSGIKEDTLKQAFILSPREGGEWLQRHPKQPHKMVKKLFQESHIPMWARDIWPILRNHEGIIAIPGIGVELSHQAQANEWGIEVNWRFHLSHGQGGGSHVKI
ncbi:MAG: tRNA lysidine(34) synthetase TilS [Betaproteobacteria bacterium]|nr:tRNA lysidine(34) synthetase TilS [Betaproteobacteria bacterium]MDE2423770.1 tRNA lysidine(34) synthetase TilS [Betaproteobacteria bacterium]